MQDPSQLTGQKSPNQDYAINHSISTNPLLSSMQNMDSCPYYINEQNGAETQNQVASQQSEQRQKNANQPNPYYLPEEPSFSDRPVFHNTDIEIKKKDKKSTPRKTQQNQRQNQQDYIRLVNQGNGNYHRLNNSRAQSGCCDDCCTQKCLGQCCTGVCVNCALQICLQCFFQFICQAIRKL